LAVVGLAATVGGALKRGGCTVGVAIGRRVVGKFNGIGATLDVASAGDDGARFRAMPGKAQIANC
jgi:hypothetical protein